MPTNSEHSELRPLWLADGGQTLGAVADVVGTPFTLHYQSDRTPGGNVVEIPVSGDTVPAGVTAFEVTVHVAGRDFVKRISPPAPNKSILFAWDGKDQDGKHPVGPQWGTIEVVDIYKVGSSEARWNPRVWGGTLGTWDTRAIGMGGWSLNVLHYYDPKDQVLYLGDGSRRSGTRLGAVKENGAETYIASEDGLAIYVFDTDTGLHQRTLHGLTKAPVYTFGYTSNRLTSITDGDGNVTTIGAGGITGPFGEQTSLVAGPGDYWATIGQGVGAMQMTYTQRSDDFGPSTASTPFAAGLLQTLTDPRGSLWTYAFDARGRLMQDNDARGGAIHSERTSLAGTPPAGADDYYKLTLRTAGGKPFEREVTNYNDGRRARTIRTPDGDATITTTVSVQRDLSVSASDSKGETASTTYVPGQVADSTVTLMPGWGTVRSQHHVTWADPTDPLTIASIAAGSGFNSATASSAVTAGAVTTTTPGGRTITTQIDNQGRPTSITVPDLPTTHITYDHGRVTEVTQGGRKLSYAYTGAFVSSVTDTLGRVVSVNRNAAGFVTGATDPAQSFTTTPDNNGNVTSVSSPQAGSYGESGSYDPVGLLTTYTVPAGSPSLSYDVDRTPTTSTSPWGDLAFDSKGRLTGMGGVHYTYNDDDVLTGVNSPDGSMSVTNTGPAPTQLQWNGTGANAVSGTVDLTRNDLFQVTGITVGGLHVDRTVDKDGVLTQAGDLSIGRTPGGLMTGSTLGDVTDTYERNTYGEPTRYSAAAGSTELFTEEFARDPAGRILASPVRIRNPLTGDLEAYKAAYGYDAPGHLQTVQYNDGPVVVYAYDDHNNLVGSSSGAGSAVHTRLYLQDAPASPTPGTRAGTWTTDAGPPVAQMAPWKSGRSTPAAVAPATCADGQSVLATVFVSPPLAETHTVASGDPLAVVMGAAAQADDALRGRVTLWVMTSSGSKRCELTKDQVLSTAATETAAAQGIGGALTVSGSCAGQTLQAGDRIVAELGFACTAETVPPVAASLYRGGAGTALSDGAAVGTGACAHPGYVELAGSWSFDATPNPSVVCDNGTVPLTLAARQLHAVTVNSDNQVQEADLTDPAGIHHHYTYQFDTRGALASKTDTITSTTYSYDVFGNLRSVGLPDGHTISYAIDAAQRRVGKAIDGSTVQAFLYQSALQPVAELDGSGQVRRLFVYADKTNVPAYMIQAPDTGQLSAHSYRIITDHLGSVRLVVDASDGTIMQRMDYDEHGNVLFDYVAPDFERVPFGYAGGLYDPDTGIVRFGARDYDPEIARWTASDPVGFGGGDGNIYGYAGNNPVNLIDPSGLKDCLVDGKAVPCRVEVDYDPVTSTGTLSLIGNVNGQQQSLLQGDVIVGGERHRTPTGTFHALRWEKDHVSKLYGGAADTPWSKSWLGWNAFGPYQLHIRELESRGVYIHGTIGPSWSPTTWGNAMFLSPTSHGCIRMANRDIIRLHDLMPDPAGNTICIKEK